MASVQDRLADLWALSGLSNKTAKTGKIFLSLRSTVERKDAQQSPHPPTPPPLPLRVNLSLCPGGFMGRFCLSAAHMQPRVSGDKLSELRV